MRWLERIHTKLRYQTGGTKTTSKNQVRLDQVGLGYVRLGQVGLGQVGLSQVKLGQVRLGQVRLGQVRLGQVRLGWVRLGQVRLGQVRLGQVRWGFFLLSYAVMPLNKINNFVFQMDRDSVLYEVRTEFFYVIYIKASLQRVKWELDGDSFFSVTFIS